MNIENRNVFWVEKVLGLQAKKRRNLVLESFEIDTRKRFGPRAIFVALDGEHFDGHDYIDNAMKKGAICFITTKDIETDLPYFLVEDTLLALQSIARAWREEQTQTHVIAVTGSNGKTFVKDLLASMLVSLGDTFRSPGSYNSQIGVAMSLLNLRESHRFAVIEAGISKPQEMKKLEAMIQPDAGIWTNVGDAHLGGLKNRTGIAQEKKRLFVNCEGPVIFPKEDLYISKNLDAKHPNPIEISSIDTQRFKVGSRTYQINIPGEHNQINAALAASMALFCGVDNDQVVSAILAQNSSKLRLEMHTTMAGITLLNDCYNADPTSVKSALASLEHYGSGRKKIVVLGDMLDLGSFSEDAHEQIGQAVGKVADRLFLHGNFAKYVLRGATFAGLEKSKITIHSDLEDLASAVKEVVTRGDYLLFKASRMVELDKVASQFFESVASTRLEINLDTIAENVNNLRNLVGKKTGILAVIKSFAYGSDSTRVAQTLVNNGIDGFVVAFPNEGRPLRERGIDLPIIVTNVTKYEADKIINYDLQAVVSRKGVVDALSKHRGDKTIEVHIEIDSGMNRLGIHPDKVLDFAEYIQQTPGIKIVGIMTHLASADEPNQDAFTRAQIARFDSALSDLSQAGIDYGKVHIGNTAGAIRFPEARRDFVRVGLGVYGFSPSQSVTESAGKKLKPALSMSTRIIDIHQIKSGESLGYGQSWTAKRDSKIGTIACGYYDGFPRFMSNGGEVLIGNQRVPVVGKVCMDVSMIDLTDIETVREGDRVVIFGEYEGYEISVNEIADRGNTINYEILTGISSRVKRIFLKS